MVTWFILSSITFVVFALAYLTWHFYQVLPNIKYQKSIACLITVGLFSLLAIQFVVFGFIVNICIAFVICDIVSLILCKTKTIQRYWQKVYYHGILAIALSLVLSGYGIYNAYHIVTTPYTVSIDKSCKDTKIMVASDMHISTTVTKDGLDTFKNTVLKNKPEYVFLVGDIYDESSKEEDVAYSMEVFKEIQRQCPIYYVMGNHELGHVDGTPGPYQKHYLEKRFKDIGVTTLLDQTIEVDDLVIVGRQDVRSKKRATLDVLLEGVNVSKPIVVLDHQPVDVKTNSTLGVDIQISGHTHGGQMFPVGEISQLVGINEMNYGIRTIDGFSAIVTSGMGTWGYPMRTRYHSEIIELTIQSKQ